MRVAGDVDVASRGPGHSAMRVYVDASGAFIPRTPATRICCVTAFMLPSAPIPIDTEATPAGAVNEEMLPPIQRVPPLWRGRLGTGRYSRRGPHRQGCPSPLQTRVVHSYITRRSSENSCTWRTEHLHVAAECVV